MKKLFIKTPPQPCSYLPEKERQLALVNIPLTHIEYASGKTLSDIERMKKAHNLERGSFAEGPYSYITTCFNCRACIPVRINVQDAQLSKSKRRILKRNADLNFEVQKAHYMPSFWPLYQQYMQSRHPNNMTPGYSEDHLEKGLKSVSHTVVITAPDGQLMAFAQIDIYPEKQLINLEKLFYDPEQSQKRSLGKFFYYKMIELAATSNIKHLYLGVWVKGNPNLEYKSQLPGLEACADGVWEPLDKERHKKGPAPFEFIENLEI